MAFITQLEWDEDFPFDRYQDMAARAHSDGKLPAGCHARLVGCVDGGARVFEVWVSADDARRFGERSGPLLAEFKMPMPTRSAAYDLDIFRTS